MPILVTFPLDITKTRLQTQGEVAAQLTEASGFKKRAYRGMFKTAVGIGKVSKLLPFQRLPVNPSF